MILLDLPLNQCKVLRRLYAEGEQTMKQLREVLCPPHGKMPPGTVSGALSRLQALGLVDAPESYGGSWAISLDGARLFAPQAAPVVEESSTTAEEPGPEPEFEADLDLEPEPEPEPDPIPEFEDLEMAPPPISHEVLAALEVEMDLHKVRAKLALPLVPARSARVYREVVDCLPESLQEALRPISDLIAGLP